VVLNSVFLNECIEAGQADELRGIAGISTGGTSFGEILRTASAVEPEMAKV
jgi:hypothetical protein